MCGECAALLQEAQAELEHARGLLAHARNRTKVETSALGDSVARMERISRRIEARLTTSPRLKGAPGNGKHEVLSQAH